MAQKIKAKLDDERTLKPNMIMIWEEDELEKIKKYVGEKRLCEKGKFDLATKLFNELILMKISKNFNLKSLSVYLVSNKN